MLEGQFKKEASEKYSEEQIKIWRRSMDVPPPEMSKENENHPIHDQRYSHVPREKIPSAECLNDVIKRVRPFYEEELFSKIQEGRKIILITHGSVLRAFLKIIFN